MELKTHMLKKNQLNGWPDVKWEANTLLKLAGITTDEVLWMDPGHSQ